MGLKWVLSSAFTHVVGHTDKATMEKNRGLGMSKEEYRNGFEMPLHYPRYSKADYEKMEEEKIDMLLKEYGLKFNGSVEEKRAFAMGTFLWPDQL